MLTNKMDSMIKRISSQEPLKIPRTQNEEEEDQRSLVDGPHEDEYIKELQCVGKSASDDEFEESMHI
ncbi:hypothetical protein H5410_051663 [Solanum commersonii]|uniref:Uncharacterized protein n=1 Tax=Solanum commersonii TaxID=4109 RepID=A0A9J5X167_SOLCO|nr:hypothetical protein H5410_051663 [Solanum commersonii]